MAAKFKKGELVELNMVVPKGPVLSFRMEEDGTVYCLVEWNDKDGQLQQRWFAEDDLLPGT